MGTFKHFINEAKLDIDDYIEFIEKQFEWPFWSDVAGEEAAFEYDIYLKKKQKI